MNRYQRNRNRRQQQIHLLAAATRKSHQRKQLGRMAGWCALVLLSLTLVGTATHFAMQALLRSTLYENPHYTLKEIVVDAKGSSISRQIRQIASRAAGQNLMKMDLRQIQSEIESLPYVARASVEKQLPSKLVIHITERMPLVKITAYDADMKSQEVFYLDRERVAMKPRAGEAQRAMPELVGLKNLTLQAGQVVDVREVAAALDLLKAMEMTPLRTILDIRQIDLAQPLALKVFTPQGTTLVFRLDHIQEQITRLQEIVAYAQERNQQMRTVDLTPERNVPVTWMPISNVNPIP